MLNLPAGELLQQVQGKTVAVASGKGGVGKTTTAANLAVYSARSGLSTAIIDLDPLSDIPVIFDLNEKAAAGNQQGKGPFGGFTFPVCTKLDMLTAHSTRGKPNNLQLIRTLFQENLQALNDQYEFIIIDLPAGENFEDNIMFLPVAGSILVVTNPEPTAHVSAGGYLKKVFEFYPGKTVFVWHNKFTRHTSLDFDSAGLVENYNRNVQKEARFTREEAGSIRDLALVPPDQSLDLLKTEISYENQIISNMIDLLRYILEEKVAEFAVDLPFSKNTLDILKYYLARNWDTGNIDRYLNELGEYVVNLVASSAQAALDDLAVFSPKERTALEDLVENLNNDPLQRNIIRAVKILEEKVTGKSGKDLKQTIDRELTQLLMKLNSEARTKNEIKKTGGLFLFYFSLFKLVQSDTVGSLLDNLLPKKKDKQGALVRDRYTQLRRLIEGDTEYRESFKTLIKQFYPILQKQLSNTVSVLNIPNLVYTLDHKMQGKAYLKLLTSFLHDIVYSGLGIIIGFNYRTAAHYFQIGAKRLLENMKS